MPAFPFLLTDFDVDRILSLENAKLGTLFTVLVSVGRRLLAPACAHAQQAGRSPVARHSIEVFAFYIYLVPRIPAISGVSTFGGNLYAKKPEMLTHNFKDFSLLLGLFQISCNFIIR